MGINENKSVVEEALLQIKNLEDAINENAKGILASTMKEEISELVKESLGGYKKNLREQDAPEEPEGEEEIDADAEMDFEPEGEDEVDFSAVEKFDEPQGDENVGDTSDLEEPMMMGDNEEGDEMPPLDMTTATPEEILKVFKAMGDEDGIIVKKDNDYIHLKDNDTDAEYLISDADDTFEDNEQAQMAENVIYELEVDESDNLEMYMDEEDMYNEEDEFEGWHMDEEEEFEGMYMDEEEEFEGMYMDEEEEFEGMYMDEEEEFEGWDMDEEEQEENVYEIDQDVLDSVMESFRAIGLGFGKPMKTFSKMEVNNKGFKDEMKLGDKNKRKGPKFNYPKIKHGVTEMEDKELDEVDEMEAEHNEAARTYGKGSKRGRGLRKGITPNRNLVYGENGVHTESVQQEVNLLREKNEEYKKALDFFRNKLNEVAVFNSNLAYSTRLFTEHSTTKQEKINILRRFDEVDTLKESKSLYKTIKTELDGKGSTNTIKESIERRVVQTPSNGSSTNLIENKTYENPQFLRMKDLMGKIK